jgi:hypothetical protein
MTHHDHGAARPDGFNGSALALAQGLGWFSVGLGLVELAAPHSLARFLGMEEQAGLIRAYGLRELTTGAGILLQDDPAPWLWARVAGDALDLATLATALDARNPQRGNVGVALAAVAGVTALDALCAQRLSGDGHFRTPVRDYSDRRGMPRHPLAMRGVARNFEVPNDMRIPEAMRPYPKEKFA